MRAVHTALITGACSSLLLLGGPARSASAEIVMKILIVNPSDTDTKEFSIHSVLPPEIKPEHVLDADGLAVDYDSRAGMYALVGKVTLKPKASVSKHIVLEDVWVIPADRFEAVRQEITTVMQKLAGTPYHDQGQLIGDAVERHLKEVEASQRQPFTNPEQHISLYRDNLKGLQSLDSEMVSLRQLMVMAALQPTKPQPVVTGAGAGTSSEGAGQDRGGLSILTTWHIIFIVLGLLVLVSLSFFLIWQRQLKLQLAKEAATAAQEQRATSGDDLLTSGNGGTPSVSPGVQPKAP